MTDWFTQNAPTPPPAATPPQGGDWFAANAPGAKPPDFRSSNALDEQGHSVVGDVASTWKWLNTSPLEAPIHSAASAIANFLDAPSKDRSVVDATNAGMRAGMVEGLGNVVSGFTTPLGLALTLAGLTGESSVVKAMPALKPLLELPAVKLLQRAVQGAGGAGFAAQGASDTFGRDRTLGQRAQGVAEMAAGAAGLATAVRPSAATPAPPSATPRLTPEETASNAFADAEGVPLDAATRTGSRTLRAMEKRTANSIGGEGTAERLLNDQQQALQRTGANIAERATGQPAQTAETAGGGVRAEIEQLIGNLHGEATKAYDQLRGVEDNPTYAARVNTAQEGAPAFQKIAEKLAKTEHVGKPGGQPVLRDELVVMRQLETALEAQPYSEGGMSKDATDYNRGTYVRGKAGTPVYDEILQLTPGDAQMTRSEVQDGIRRTLESGDWNNASIGAYRLARKWLGASWDSSTQGPRLAQDAPLLGKSEVVPLPVDLTTFKRAAAPMYEALKREAQLVPLQGDKGRAFVALDRLMNGPDITRASAAEAALGDLKAMARGAAMPELRTQGQGTAAAAVGLLDQAVKAGVGKAGPKALDALETGRAQTAAKYQVADVLDKLREEPVQTFRALTSGRDTQVDLLRRVSDVAPEAMPKIARAWLDQQLESATERGRFDHADRIYAEWQKMGPQTKALLFPDQTHRAALDHFFLLAKRLGENPNPSGTAHVNNVFNWGSTVVSYPAAKLLQTASGARFMARMMSMRLPPAPSGVTSAAQKAAWVQVATAARASGLPLAFPAAAQDSTQEPGTRP